LIRITLRSKSGESIIEALVSVLILGMLLGTIVSIIRFSLALTGTTLRDATAAQTEINDLILDRYPAAAVGTLKFTSSNAPIDAEHGIVFYSDDGITAFYPGGSGG